MANTNLFNPIVGSEERVLNYPVSPGAVYFTTDTRKIYLDYDQERVKMPMGGNIGLFYGNMKLTSPVPAEQKEFDFSIDDIVSNAFGQTLKPNVDDLILNQDGCFYKVLSFSGTGDDLVLQTEKLTIAGTGGGGGGGGGNGDPDSLAGFKMSRLSLESAAIIYGRSCPVSFAAQLTDDLGDPTRGYVGTYTLYINGAEKESGKVIGVTSGDVMDLKTVSSEEKMVIDVGSYLPLGENIEVKVSVKSNSGVTITRATQVSTTNMTLTWKYDENHYETWESADSGVKLEWEISGTGFSKTTYIVIDGDTSRTIRINSTSTNQTKFDYFLNFSAHGLYHGAHSIKMWAEASIGNATTDPIYKNMMLVRGSTATIISAGLFTKDLRQYDTIKIPIKIYSPLNTGANATIKMYANGGFVGEFNNVANFEDKMWTYTPTIYGNDISLEIICNDGRWVQKVNIEKIDIDISEVPGYALKFKANEFANNQGVQNWTVNNQHITFSEKFDWINGGLQSEVDENGGARQYFMVKAGSSMTIPYNIWARNAATGKHLKVIFKATNCRDYDAQVLSCKTDKQIVSVDKAVEYLFLTENVTTLTYSDSYQRNGYSLTLANPQTGSLDLTNAESRKLFQDKYVIFDNEMYQCNLVAIPGEEGEEPTYYAAWHKTFVEDSFNGLLMRAQNATFKTEGRTLDTQYYEDSYIEFEMEVTANPRYMKLWIDGIPCAYTKYSNNEIFSGANAITIGSNECDVCIYLIKIYEKELSLDDHMSNFYIDASNASEMVSRFKRNDILYLTNSNTNMNDIDPARLAKANPDCLVHVYEIPRMTKTKRDEVYPCQYQQLKGSGVAQYSANNVMIKVQGTSSEKYVVSAANIDTDFVYTKNNNVPSGWKDSEGNVLPNGWSMDGQAIPINYACTKVNVASCENANNALNQEWYNIFQPYQSVLRCKKSNARDTMQFTNGVMFMIDRNEKFDVKAVDPKDNNLFGEVIGYTSSPYAKFYSLAQMGNSKDNVHVCHDIDNPLECCIEVADNQTPQQWMVSDDYKLEDIGESENYFGFRYPDGIDEVRARGADGQKMIKGWNDFVYWMAHSNPSAKYNKFTDITTEAQYKDFSINKRTRTPIDVYIMNADETDYIKVDGLQSGVTTYYTETEHVHGHTNLKLQTPETYAPYKFRGFRAENQKREDGTLWQKDYTPVVSTFTEISEYAGTYEYDTYERRMAKMLQECEDHLIMDSVLFHYLFIERHCMIDNVAKNTFWSTEDCQHWSLIKDYDNDTADGTDNNGKFTRNYAMEVMDRLNANKMVFNAHQSVWLNFVHGLHEARQQMYKALETKKVDYKGRTITVWSAQDYLRVFNEWQKMIPERCWIEDYRRKYFRPSELYNVDMFNEMMEGGQKKHQRAQYENYQEIYMSSEYDGNTTSSSYLWFRPTGSGLARVRIPVQVYSDCYVRMEMGGQLSNERVKRNTVVYMDTPIDELNEATMSITPAQVVTKIGSVDNPAMQIGTYAPDMASFSNAPKLRELVLATSDNTVVNQGLKTGMSFTGNTLLEKLYVANLSVYSEGLDLSTCSSLVEVDATGSTFTEVAIADGAPVEKIVLQAPTSLTLSNLSELQELTIKDKSKLTTLLLNNIDNSSINSRTIVNDVLTALKNVGSTQPLQYKLTNVKWRLNSSDDIASEKIKILDTLLNTTRAIPIYADNKVDRIPYSGALTGALNVSANAYNGTNALGIYDTYITSSKFGNLELDFETSNSTLYTIYIYDGNGNVFWRRKVNPGTRITEMLLGAGPNGAFDVNTIYKTSTDQYEYTFLNSWRIKDDRDENIGTINTALPIGIDVNQNIHLYPDFRESIRSYDIIIKSKHPTSGQVTTWREGTYIYGTPLNQVIPLDKVPYFDSDGLNLTKYAAYDCKGYSLSEDSSILVSEAYVVKNNETLWAVMELENDIRTIVHPEWFSGAIEEYSKEDGYDFGKKSGIVLRPKTVNGKQFQFPDKVVIPSTFVINGSEKPVIGIEGFGGTASAPTAQDKVKYVFVEKDKPNTLYWIKERAFGYMPNLKYFDFDNCQARYIDKEAFRSDMNLTNTTFSNSLWKVGIDAFNGAIKSNGPTNIIIPSSVISVNERGFAHLNIGAGSTLTIGFSETNLSQLDLGSTHKQAFRMNNNNKYAAVIFYSASLDNNSNDIVHASDWFKECFPDGTDLSGGALTIY